MYIGIGVLGGCEALGTATLWLKLSLSSHIYINADGSATLLVKPDSRTPWRWSLSVPIYDMITAV